MLKALLTRYERAPEEHVNWLTSTPFILVHALPLAAIWTGFTRFDMLLCAALFAVKMFCITAGYHRYFSHRAFKTSRIVQFVLAFGGGMAAQKGALWWGAHHRHHHRYSDQPEDIHSPMKGFWWSHIGWITCDRYNDTQYGAIKDFAHYPELRFLNEHYLIPPAALGLSCFLAGGWSALWIGFFLSTVLTYHATFLINSATHLFGRRRYALDDTSRNSFLMALLTFGEGWHNNHHHCQASAKMGFYWWEIDISYYLLKLLYWFGLVWDLRVPSQAVREANWVGDGNPDIGMLVFQD